MGPRAGASAAFARMLWSLDHTSTALALQQEATAWITEAARARGQTLSAAQLDAELERGVRCWLIGDMDRAYGAAAGLEFVELLGELRRSGRAERVIGVGSDSTELGVDFRVFAPAFEAARRSGFRTTCHAGEAVGAGPENISIALDALGVDRARAVEQPLEPGQARFHPARDGGGERIDADRAEGEDPERAEGVAGQEVGIGEQHRDDVGRPPQLHGGNASPHRASLGQAGGREGGERDPEGERRGRAEARDRAAHAGCPGGWLTVAEPAGKRLGWIALNAVGRSS